MDNILNLSPLETVVVFALNAWIFVIFPVIVLKKINYMTAMLEAQFENDPEEVEA